VLCVCDVDLSGFEPGQSAYVSSTRQHSAHASTMLLPPVMLLLLLLHVVRWCYWILSATQRSRIHR